MITIGIHSVNAKGAASLYRCHGPFGHLVRKHPEIQIVFLTEESMNWMSFQTLDIVFFHMAASDEALKWIEEAKRVGCKVWLDYDDDLLNIPSWNKSYTYFEQESVKNTLKSIVKSADLITYSTKTLLTEFTSQMNPGVEAFVIPNAIDLRWFTGKVKHHPEVITWRGGDSHLGDVMPYSMWVKKIAAENPKAHFHFHGWNPFPLTDSLPGRFLYVNNPIFKYHRELEARGGKCGIIPLADCKFNRAKSNIAWLELAITGHVVVAPDFPEFRQPGVVPYKTPEEFYFGVKKVMRGEMDEERQAGIDEIWRKYTLDHTNFARKVAAKRLMGGRE